MSVTVTMEFESIDAAITSLAKLRLPDSKDAAAAPAKPVKADKPAATPPTATAAAAPATPPTASAPPAGPTAAQAAADSTALYERVKHAITAATKDSANVPKVKGVLGTFGAKTGKDLKAEDYEKFLAALEGAMAASEDLS